MDIVKRDDLIVRQINTGCLAQFSYIVVSNGEAFVIDPLRDVQMYMVMSKELGADIKYVAETHYHADFVSGYHDLAKKAGATIVFGPESNPDFDCMVTKDGQVIKVGNYQIRTLHTPGHTLESSTYLLESPSEEHICVFTGDTLFLGDVGRPDLAQKAGELTKEDLATKLFHSCLKLKQLLGDDVLVFPGHGAGSACGKSIQSGTYSTIGDQKKTNYAFKLEDEQEFVKAVAGGLLKPPSYFGNDVSMNKNPNLKEVDQIVAEAKAFDIAEFKELSKADDTFIIDSRSKTAYVKGHLPQAIFVPLTGKYAIWTAFLVKPHEKILLVTDEGKEEESTYRLARVGLDNVLGHLKGGFEAWKAAGEEVQTLDLYHPETPEEFESKLKDKHLLDIRSQGEWGNGAHEQAYLTSLTYVRDIFEANQGEGATWHHGNVLVTCQSGGRSLVTASFLASKGVKGIESLDGGVNRLKEIGVKLVPRGISD